MKSWIKLIFLVTTRICASWNSETTNVCSKDLPARNTGSLIWPYVLTLLPENDVSFNLHGWISSNLPIDLTNDSATIDTDEPESTKKFAGFCAQLPLTRMQLPLLPPSSLQLSSWGDLLSTFVPPLSSLKRRYDWA